MKKQIGKFNEKVIQLLSLSILCNTPIYISDTNILHMQTSHPGDYQKYSSDIKIILETPDYVGINPKDNSIEFIKEYMVNGEYILCSVVICFKPKASKKLYCKRIFEKIIAP